MAQIKQELKDKLERDGVAGFLDGEDTLERVIPGPGEEERNLSRLNKIITGESRPASHTAKEGVAKATYYGLPILLAWIRGADLATKGARGLKEIAKYPGDVQQASKAAEKAVGKAVKKAAKKDAAKKASQESKSIFGKLLKAGMDNTTTGIEHRAAKEIKKDVDVAIKALNDEPAKPLPMEMIKDYAEKKGKNVLKVGLGATKSADVLSKMPYDKGYATDIDEDYPETSMEDYEYNEDPGLERYDTKHPAKYAWNSYKDFMKGLIGLDDLDPSLYPMDLINNLLIQTNAEVNMWDGDYLENLSDRSKIALVKNIMKGKYDILDSVSGAMKKTYLDLTNNDEE